MNIPSVRTSLALAVVGCILPIAVVAAVLIFNFYQHERTRLTIDAISRVRAMTSAVDREIATTQAALRALATSPLLAKGDLGAFHAQAVEALRGLRAESIVVMDTQGQFLLTTRRPYGEPLQKLANPPLLRMRRVLETGEPGVSDLFFGPMADRPIFAIGVPVKLDGAIPYSLSATVGPAQLSSVLTEQKLPDSWRASIIDSSGSVVARTHEVEKFLGKQVSPGLLRRIGIADENGYEARTLDDIPVITVYSRSPVTRWAVVLGMPLGELTAGLRRTLTWLVVATLAALVIGLSLAWFIGGRIATSITALIKPAIALGSGEMPPIPHLHFREANEMRQALLEAATKLQQAKYESHHDVLTGLANRALFRIVVDHQLALCQRNKTDLAILYVDLDGFKGVNDTHGHAAGDQLLCAVAIRIKGVIRESDIAARLGGDEFAIALINSDPEDANAFAGRLTGILSDPYRLGGVEATISASIGVAGYSVSAADCDTLLKNADRAMYKAKALAKQRILA